MQAITIDETGKRSTFYLNVDPKNGRCLLYVFGEHNGATLDLRFCEGAGIGHDLLIHLLKKTGYQRDEALYSFLHIVDDVYHYTDPRPFNELFSERNF